MIVQCEKCGTKYKIDDSKVRAEEIKVRCSKCQHIFNISHPPTLHEKEVFGEMEERVEGPSLKQWQDEFTMKSVEKESKTTPPTVDERAAPTPFVPPPPEEKKIEEGPEEETLISEEDLFPFRASIPEVAPPKQKRKLSGAFLVAIILIAVFCGLAYYWTQRGGSFPFFESIYERISNVVGGKKDHKIFLTYLRGYELTLEGEKIYAIQGKVVNRSNQTKKYVKLKGFLFDKQGKTVASSIGYSGRSITNSEIKGSTYASLKSSFGFMGPGKAPPIPPQQNLPFTIIFFSPTAAATEFKVEIVETPPTT